MSGKWDGWKHGNKGTKTVDYPTQAGVPRKKEDWYKYIKPAHPYIVYEPDKYPESRYPAPSLWLRVLQRIINGLTEIILASIAGFWIFISGFLYAMKVMG
jgi:hypothetical protein